VVRSSIGTIIQNKTWKSTQKRLSTKWSICHGRPCLLTWTLYKISGWTEEKKHQHVAVNLKDLERFCMKEWSPISYQVFSKLFKHCRIKFRAVILGKGCCNNWVPIIVANIYFTMRFSPYFQLFYFNDMLEFCEWKIKRINNAHLFSGAFAHINQLS